MKEFDAEYFARTMRKVEMILASTMDDSEHFLVNYQQSNAIKFDEDSSSDSDEDPRKHFRNIPNVKSKKAKQENHLEKVNEFVVSGSV